MSRAELRIIKRVCFLAAVYVSVYTKKKLGMSNYFSKVAEHEFVTVIQYQIEKIYNGRKEN